MAPTSFFNFDAVKDDDLRDHLNGLIDAVTGGPVTSRTTLVKLEQRNWVLKDLTGPGRLVPCTLVLPDGKEYPIPGDDTIKLSVTYNRLLLAPKIRLVCDIKRLVDHDTGEHLRFFLEFHFNDYGSKSRGIKKCSFDKDAIAFTAQGATHSGTTNLRNAYLFLDASENRTVAAVMGLIQPESPVEVILKLEMSGTNDLDLSYVERVHDRLPGGRQPLLPSIGLVEYHAFGDGMETTDMEPPLKKGPPSERFTRPLPGDLISRAVCLPFVPYKSEDTFSTKKEAIVELFHSALGADMESRQSLNLWATRLHKAKLYRCSKFHVIAVPYFERFRILGQEKIQEGTDIRLPKGLEVRMQFEIRGVYESYGYDPETRYDDRLVGVLLEDNPGLPYHRAFFRVTSKMPDKLREFASLPGDEQVRSFRVDFEPHYNAFTFNGQMNTLRQLQKDSRWDDILLNQSYDGLLEVDTTEKSEMSAADKQALDHVLRSCKHWAPEQLAVIDSLTRTAGGLTLVMGPEGTGKSTLQRALMLYYWCLGFHILSLGPANEACNHTVALMKMKELRKEFPAFTPYLSDFRALRLFPGARDIKLESMTENQAAHRFVGHKDGGVVSFHDLLIALDEKEKVGGTVHELGVVQTMIRLAEEDDLSAHGLAKDRERAIAWDGLKEVIQMHKDKTLPAREAEKKGYGESFQMCKSDLISANRFMVTTTSNARSTELLGSWFRENGAPCVGVIVFVDESTRDVEANVWSGIVCEKWARSVEGVFLFGDEKRMKPINTCFTNRAQYTPFAGRLDVALPTRLIRQGFPVFRLEEQRRMHPALTAFPRDYIYNGRFRDAPEMLKPLDDTMPGLRSVLTDIIAEHGIHDEVDREAYRLEASDAKARLHWLQVEGTKGDEQVPKHVQLFFETIFPKLRAYFESRGKKLVDNVLLVCAYNKQLHLYKDHVKRLIDSGTFRGKAISDVLRILTVDGSQSREAPIVILDGSFQDGLKMGFMWEQDRANVAITRATEVLWVIGGEMRTGGIRGEYVPLITHYKQEMEAKGHVHEFTKKPQAFKKEGALRISHGSAPSL